MINVRNLGLALVYLMIDDLRNALLSTTLLGTEDGLPSGDFSVEELANVTLKGPDNSVSTRGVAKGLRHLL